MSKDSGDSCDEHGLMEKVGEISVIESKEPHIKPVTVQDIADTDKQNISLRNRKRQQFDDGSTNDTQNYDMTLVSTLTSDDEYIGKRLSPKCSAPDIVNQRCGDKSHQVGDFHNQFSLEAEAKSLDDSFYSLEPEDISQPSGVEVAEKPSGFASYLWSELSRGYEPDENEAVYNVKRDRVSAFLLMPKECEQFMLYGVLQCIDSFLFIFTFLPLRLIIIILKLLSRPWTLCMPHYYLSASQRCDMVKGVIIALNCLLLYYLDVSMIYHIIRGQAVIKLYLFFNLLEIGDRLLSSFGQDILDAVMWTVADPKRQSNSALLFNLIVGVIYVFLHSILVLLQASALNVAFNSHSKVLLTILISNNAVELKGSVFKKFEKTNLFQMSCSDVRERFHIQILIFIVCLRNMTDFNWDIEKFYELIPDILMLTVCELVVDNTKHAFITKFNNIPSAVYREYTVLLANDVITSRKKNAFSDVSDQISRRLGLIPLPLACLLIKIVTQCFKVHSPLAIINTVLGFLCLLGAKLVIGVIVYGWAVDYCNDYRTEQAKLSERQRHKSATGIDEDLLKCENNYHWHKKPATELSSPSLHVHSGEPLR